MTLTFGLIFKITFLFLLIIISLYLLHQEIMYYDKLNLHSNSNNSLTQNSKFIRLLKDMVFVVIPAGMSYHTFIKGQFNQNQESLHTQTLNQKMNEIKALQAENEALKNAKTNVVKYSENIRQTSLELFKSRLNLEKLKILRWREKKEIEDLKIKKSLNNGNNLSEMEENKIISEPNLNLQIEQTEQNIKQNFDKIDQIGKSIDIDFYDIKKSSIFISDFNLQNFLDSLSKEELLAFSGLLLNGLALNYVFNIILVLYGDYLIKRFDLENRYPKLAKLIQLRRKLQQYYLKLCFTWIFICILPQIGMYIFILFPKIVELFI